MVCVCAQRGVSDEDGESLSAAESATVMSLSDAAGSDDDNFHCT